MESVIRNQKPAIWAGPLPFTAIFALNIFLSAFLVFLIQPIISKMILPFLGGSASVWNTSMFFFQACLLLGYLYAYLSSQYLKPKTQIAVHVALLLLSLGYQSFALPLNAAVRANDSPILWQLREMILAIGLPFIVLSGSAPLLQRWFASGKHRMGENPYVLYAASNLGSLLGLLSYPLAIESTWALSSQGDLWIKFYYVLICGLSLLWFAVSNHTLELTKKEPISWRRKIQWLGLAFVPSSLLLSVTTYMTTDVAPVPLFWIVPFSLYLISFMVTFSGKYPQSVLSADKVTLSLAVLLLLSAALMQTPWSNLVLFFLHLSFFFLISLLFHHKLYQKRPEIPNLTQFYLYISMGGLLGGLFNVLIAPNIFLNVEEYSVVALAGALWLKHWPMTIFVALLLLPNYISLFEPIFASKTQIIYRNRSFYGAVHVASVKEGNQIDHLFYHGGTLHGTQSLNHPELAASYYHDKSPIRDLLLKLKQSEPQNIAVVGLGVGTLASFANEKRHMDFFEIDPMVITMAQDPNLFTYLKQAKGPVHIVAGDARLKLQEQADKRYHMIIMDAFSSDKVPVHLLTQEAISLFLSKLSSDGLLIYHISNHWLDLEPVLAKAGDILGKTVLIKKIVVDKPSIYTMSSRWVVILSKPELIQQLLALGWTPAHSPQSFRVWGDDYSNLLGVFRR